MPAAVETMMYNKREVPWHGLGTPVDGLRTAAEAITAAGMDWRVGLEPVCTADGDEIEGYQRVARDKDNDTLGIVGSAYKVIQNAEAFDFMDSLVDSGDAKYETAGSLKGGRVVWMLAEIPAHVWVAGEEVTPYLLLSSSHDGSGSLKVAATPVRVVCQNTLTMALGSANRTYSMRHTGKIDGKLVQARDALKLGFSYYDEFTAAGEALASHKLTDADFARFLDGILPLPENNPTRVENRRAEIAGLYFNSPNLENVRGTAWAAYNAAAEYADHFAEVRGGKTEAEQADQRTYRAWFRSSLTDRAFTVAAAI